MSISIGISFELLQLMTENQEVHPIVRRWKL